MSMIVRRLHRYLMLLIGGQMLLWSASGLYMVWFDIHYIHGDHFIKAPPLLSSSSQLEVGFDDVLVRYPRATSIVLAIQQGEPVYRFILDGESVRISGSSGEMIDPLSDKQAAAIALSRLHHRYEVGSVTLLSNSENNSIVGQRGRPLWRVDFKGLLAPTLYVSRNQGTVEYVRHAPWQWFDWLWRLHIMDYQDGEDTSNGLLVTMTLFGLLACLAGVLLIPRSWVTARKAAL